MAKILYIARNDGMAGFIKLVNTSTCERGDVFLHGPEIHFRRVKINAAANFKSSAENIALEKSPDLRLVIKDRKLRQSLVQSVEIKSGKTEDIDLIWQKLLSKAEEINDRENLLDPEHYTTCCHTLAFETLEGVGLTAPRDRFIQERAKKGYVPPPEFKAS